MASVLRGENTLCRSCGAADVPSEQGAREGETSEREVGKKEKMNAAVLRAFLRMCPCRPGASQSHHLLGPTHRRSVSRNQCWLLPRPPPLACTRFFPFSALQTSPACLCESLHCEATMSEGSLRSGRGCGHGDDRDDNGDLDDDFEKETN